MWALPILCGLWHKWGKMVRTDRKKLPLDAAMLEELALAYAARFATTRAKLEAYLHRKLRERGWGGEGPPPVKSLTERLISAGYVDDAAYAEARSGSLLRRGYGLRRVNQALHSAGISDDIRDEIRPSEAEQRRAALAMAERRGFGPFGGQLPDRARREKQLAAMLRAGHAFETARQLVDAPTIEAAQDWAAEADGVE